VRIPDVIGLGRDAAYPLVEAVGLVAPSDSHFPTKFPTDSTVDDFAVVTTVPRPGRCIEPGSTVKVLSSAPVYCQNPTEGPCYDLDGEPI
jgi:hypothetical protein